MINNNRKIVIPLLIAFAIASTVGILGIIWVRGQRVLGNDGFFYLEFAKSFKQVLPDRFGDWWPFGFPLLGTFISYSGLSTHSSLWLVSATSFFGIMWGLWWALNVPNWNRSFHLIWIFAFACAPVCPLLLYATMTEPLFSIALFGLALSLGLIPQPKAIILSVTFGLLAFCTRYVGVFTFGVIGLFFWLEREKLGNSGKSKFAVFVFIGGLLIATGLCYSNYRSYGHMTGPHPVGEERLSSWPFHLARFGWSPIGAVTSEQLLSRLGGILHLHTFVIGLLSVISLFALFVVAWVRSPSRFSRPIALLSGSYVLAIVTLRATTPFDDVNVTRTFFPIMFPIVFLLLTTFPTLQHQKRLVFIPIGMLLIGIILSLRGMSVEVRTDVRLARDVLKTIIGPDDKVSVNGEAASLAAYFQNTFMPLTFTNNGNTPVFHLTSDWKPTAAKYTVLVTNIRKGDNHDYFWDAQTIGLIQAAIAKNEIDMITSNANYILLRSKMVLSNIPAR